jgi:hypothetical protein
LRISYSKYSTFLQNPERYRLQYALGLTPEDDDVPTRMNMGRRRGSCFHALSEGVAREECITKFGKALVERCEVLMTVVPDLGPLELVEQEFDLPIGGGKHTINGRIDHGFTMHGAFGLGDYKTTKGTRTKKELSDYLGTLETSPQSHFYLKAARELGRATELFRYHVILDAKDAKHTPTYIPVDLRVGPSEVDRTMRMVYAAAETITFLTETYGPDKPWPHSNTWPCSGDKFFCGFATICGRTLPKGATPPGFTNKFKDLIQLEAA